MSRPDRSSPNESPPDRFVPQAGQNAALSGICLPQFLQNMAVFLSLCIPNKRIFIDYHTIKTGKINRKPEKNGKKRVRSGFFAERRRPDGKKRETADKMAAFFGNAIAFFKKCGIFCDDLFLFNRKMTLNNERK